MPANPSEYFPPQYFYGGKIMSVFETIKAAVTLRQAAEHYGLTVSRNGMTCCPFHEDRHPSLKLNKDYFYCFGCGASGDVIDFTSRLFGLSPYVAAQKLETDFGIGAETKPLPFPNRAEQPGEPIYPPFAEAMKEQPTVNYLLDCLLGNDLLLAEKTAEMLCDDGHIQRLSEHLGTLSEKERDCA